MVHTLPKVDLHRHLEGSLRLGTLSEIARTHGLDLLEIPAADVEALRPHVQITDDPQNFENFLAKFTVLRHFYRSPEAVARLTYEAIIDAAADNVRYLELRFSPQALARVQGFPLEDVTDWVIEAAQQATRVCDIEVGLIVTLVRHEGLAMAQKVARVAFERAHQGINGIDLAGDEVNFSAEPYREIFAQARALGLGVTVHAGEWTGAEAVHFAVEHLGAHRLGHGVRAVENAEVMELVRQRGVTFEVCLTSNVQTGAVASLEEHPLREMMSSGARVTLNTDDPSVSDSTLSDEMCHAVNHLGLDIDELWKMNMDAVDAAFLPPERKEKLRLRLNSAYAVSPVAAD
jgi:adenosine deaminase